MKYFPGPFTWLPVLALLFPFPVISQSVWIKSAGIDSLAIRTLFARDGKCFAGTSDSGVYRSEDHGLTWQDSNEGILDAGPLRTANSFSATGDTIYAAFGLSRCGS